MCANTEIDLRTQNNEIQRNGRTYVEETTKRYTPVLISTHLLLRAL